MKGAVFPRLVPPAARRFVPLAVVASAAASFFPGMSLYLYRRIAVSRREMGVLGTPKQFFGEKSKPGRGEKEPPGGGS